MFIDRKDELNLLENIYKEEKAKLIVLYGKRRVGKTELLKEFLKKKNGIYLLARQESEKNQLDIMSREIALFFNDQILEKNPFRNYDVLFEYLSLKAERIPIFFDEFPFLVETTKSLPSILQYHWDNTLKNKKMFIVLCGSSISMMESLLGYKSPLYGRRTEQIMLEPMMFKDAIKFYPNLTPKEKVETYAILGGTPAYILEFDHKKTIQENLKEKMLNKNNFLHQDVLFVLKEELKEPQKYFSIISAIAKGNSSLSEILNSTGFDKGTATKYLSVLISLQLVERQVPITEKNLQKSRKGIYKLKDNYFKFWFRFIFENTEYIEQRKQDLLINEKINPQLNHFIGKAYEIISKEWLSEKYKEFLIGSWWEKEEEIDLICLNREKKTLIACEVKWKKLSKKDCLEIISDLKEKAEKIKWNKNQKIKYMLISKEIDEQPVLEDVEFYELKDILGSYYSKGH